MVLIKRFEVVRFIKNREVGVCSFGLCLYVIIISEFLVMINNVRIV